MTNPTTPTRKVPASFTGGLIILATLLVIAGALMVIKSTSEHETNTLTIAHFSPTGETTPLTNITVTFSQPVRTDSLLEQEFSRPPVTFSPKLPVKAQWIAPDKLRLFPEVQLAPSTEYTAEVNRDFIPGKTITGETLFRFHTPRLAVKELVTTLDQDPAEPEHIFILVSLEFNYPVEPAEVDQHLTLYDHRHRKLAYTLLTEEASRYIQLVTTTIDPDQVSQITTVIDPAIRCVGGNLGLAQPYELTRTLNRTESLIVEQVNVNPSGKYGTISINFNTPVRSAVARPYIAIRPAVDFQIEERHTALKLSGQFEVGTPYTVTIRSGLIARDGAKLQSPFQQTVTLRQLEPSVGFEGDGIYLARSGNLNVGLSTVNINAVKLTIEKVYTNNLVYLTTDVNLTSDYSWISINRMGKSLFSGEIPVAMVQNEEVITPVNLRQYLQEERTGIFRLRVQDPKYYWRYKDKWVMITDLGILAKRASDDLIVWVNSLETLDPVPQVTISVLSRNNQLLLSGRTNAEGFIQFQNVRAAFAEFEPYLIIAEKDEDVSFVEFKREIDLTDFDASGDPVLLNGYSAFVYPDRDIYRPGETAHLTTIVRGVNTAVPPSFPVRLEVVAPDSRIVNEQRQQTGTTGMISFDVPLANFARTGQYTAKMMIGDTQEIGRATFNVEEFVPDRINVTVNTDREVYMIGDAVQIQVTGMNLFGPPAAGNRVKIEYRLTAKPYEPPVQYRSFTYDNPDHSFSSISETLVEDKLNAEGQLRTTLDIPPNLKPAGMLQGTVSATVLEVGGRGVTNVTQFDVHPYSAYVGLRRPEGYAELDKETTIDLIVLDQQGQPVAGHTVSISISRIYWQSVLRQQSNGRTRYVSEKQEHVVKQDQITSSGDIQHIRFTPHEYGQYRVEVTDPASGHRAAIAFYAAGWGWSPWSMEHPDRLELDVEKEHYRVGETATIQVKAPFQQGKLLITVERDRILSSQVLDMPENTATLSIPVEASFQPNVYVSATLIRSTGNLEKYAPVRAFGVVPLQVDSREHQLDIDLNTPEVIKPHQTLSIDVSVHGNAGKPVQMTLAAVDEGICQLTGFRTPDPFGHFYGKKRLEVQTYDLYGLILPEVEGAEVLLSPSGDAAYRKKRLNPVSVQRIRPVALWSGMVLTDGAGNGKIKLAVPQFNGRLRLMAVAAVDQKFGSAEKQVIVRDPIVLTPTIPLFIASGDQFEIPVSLFNGTGKTGRFTVQLTATGAVDISQATQQITLEDQAEGVVRFPVTAGNQIGTVTVTLTASGNGNQTRVMEDVPLRPSNPPITITGSGAVTGGKTQTFDFPQTVNFMPGTAEYKLTISPLPALELGPGLSYLLHYPHGCLEQTTSQVFPLLYFDAVARVVDPDLFQKNSADYYLNEGIKKLESMLLPSGQFMYWPGGSESHTWSSIYAAHFLVEARLNGYHVNERVYRQMLRGLRDITLNTGDTRWAINQTAYACYVLAKAGQPEKSVMYYLKNNRLDQMGDEGQYLLAGAFAVAGDQTSALELLPKTVRPPELNQRQTGENFYSPMRAKAIMLAVLADSQPDHASVPRLVEELSQTLRQQHGWDYTTQDAAYSYLALGKVFHKQPSTDYRGSVRVGDTLYQTFGGKDTFLAGQDWAQKTVTIQNEGPGTCYFYWQAFGVPLDAGIAEVDAGLRVRREYLTPAGSRADYQQFQSGDLIICKITLEALAENLDNVAVVDLLPAGFQIENPRLQSRQNIPWIDSKTQFETAHLDIRDDRMIIFGNLIRRQPKTFYYGLRGINPGTFTLPPITAEAMYNPATRSVASSGQITIRRF
ncbi:MAG: hypothetical protein D6675_05360 [Gemmatimonadetes bacterium]|nr:MAG: hypothetical protein D6675_05360 [Gemmatimonadota bacterium]